jgi:hypothetical protein
MKKKPDKALTAARLWVFAILLLLVTYFLWLARDFIPALATNRVAAIAIVSTNRDAKPVEIERAFAVAKKSSPINATLEPTDPAKREDYYLSVIGDTSEHAKADLDTFTKALAAAFPSAEERLSVSPNNSTVPAPNDLSRRIALGVRIAIVLMMLACQLMLVVGAFWENQGIAGMIAAIATPFTILIFPTSSSGRRTPSLHETSYTDWKFVLLLLAVTPIALLLGLWLSRGPRRIAGERRRS